VLSLQPFTFSVITATFNSEQYLEQTILSVLNQTYCNIEYIIIDGGSTDGTLDIINKYRHRIAAVVSEPDSGIYDAFNKGVRLASGDMISFLNSDDYFYDPSVLEQMAAVFSARPELKVTYGNVLMLDEKNGYERPLGKPLTYEDFRYGEMCQHPSMFVRKELFAAHGPFDLSYQIVSDMEFAAYCFKHYEKYAQYLNRIVVVFRSGGVSSNPIRRKQLLEETQRLIIQFFGQVPESMVKDVDITGYYKIWLEYLLLQKQGISRTLKTEGIHRVAIFGTMKTALYLLEDLRLEHFKAVCFLDNNPNMQGKVISGIPVYSPDRLVDDRNLSVDAILVSVETGKDIKVFEQLQGLYGQQNVAIFSWKELIQRL
jgi:glycosyltransferase involved in cell wall biosynthesis